MSTRPRRKCQPVASLAQQPEGILDPALHPDFSERIFFLIRGIIEIPIELINVYFALGRPSINAKPIIA